MNATQIQVRAFESTGLPLIIHTLTKKLFVISNFLVLSEDFQSKSQHSNAWDTVDAAKGAAIETIDLLDSDSEGLLKERIASQKVHGK